MTERGTRRRWSNQPLVLETDTRRTIGMWRLLLAFVVTATPCVVWLHGQFEYVGLSRRAEELRERHERLAEAERRVARERAALESLGSIEHWALERRGLVVPEPEQIVVVRPSGEAPADWLARDVSR